MVVWEFRGRGEEGGFCEDTIIAFADLKMLTGSTSGMSKADK